MEDFSFKIPFIGTVINYIYDFCTYKKKWNLRVFFEGRTTKDTKYYFSTRCVNNTAYNIQLTRIYIKEHKNKALLKVQGFNGYKNGIAEMEYKDIKLNKLTYDHTNIDLSPKDTEEYRNYLTTDYGSRILNNEATIKIEFQGKKTKLFIEYEVQDINQLSFFRFFITNRRIEKVIIPI